MPILPSLLNLPDWAYAPLERALFPLDPGCKSSMLQDVESGRPTEMGRRSARVGASVAAKTRPARSAEVEPPQRMEGEPSRRETPPSRGARTEARTGEIPGGHVPPEEVLVVIKRAAARRTSATRRISRLTTRALVPVHMWTNAVRLAASDDGAREEGRRRGYFYSYSNGITVRPPRSAVPSSRFPPRRWTASAPPRSSRPRPPPRTVRASAPARASRDGARTWSSPAR